MARRRNAFLIPMAIGLGCLIMSMAEGARAAEALDNPGFDDGTTEPWDAGELHEDAQAGPHALYVATPPNGTVVGQVVDVSGATAVASIYAKTDGAAVVQLQLQIFDGGFIPIRQYSSPDTPLIEEYQRISVEAEMPDGAMFVEFRVVLESGPGALWLDTASLDFSGPAPTAAPTATPQIETASPTPTSTPTATSTVDAPVTSTAGGGGQGGGGGGSGATVSPTATRTPATGSGGQPSPTAKPPPATPTPRNPGSVPVVVVPGGAGGLLANGGFEVLDGNAPAGWSKFGGELFASTGARTGMHAASLQSLTDSTKWVHQAASVMGGRWYRFTAWATRESGDGEVFLRLSWYASSDGSGTAIDQVDSLTTTSDVTWTMLDTGPVRAPAGAHSVRARLMLRPFGPVSAAFDDASLVEVEAPPPTPTATATATRVPATPTRTAVPSSPIAAPGAGSSGANAPRGFAGPVSAATGSATVRINEVLADPVEEPDNRHEWVELYNYGEQAAEISGWTIEDAVSSDALPTFTIPAGGYALVAAGDYGAPAGVLVVRPADGRIGQGLNNGGDRIALRDASGAVVDAVGYGDAADAVDFPPPAPGAGKTIGFSDVQQRWSLTVRPTPGEANLFPEEPTPVATATGVRPASTAASMGGDAEDEPAAGDDNQGVIEADGGGISPLALLIAGAAGGAGLLAGGSRLLRMVEGRRRPNAR